MNTNYVVFFGIAIGILLVLSLWDCQRVKPYSTERYLSIYEGMEDDDEEGFEDDEEGFESSDIFSDSPSSISCSSGLSNSGGDLCLSKDQQMALRTRGGNSSTGEAQIGN